MEDARMGQNAQHPRSAPVPTDRGAPVRRLRRPAMPGRDRDGFASDRNAPTRTLTSGLCIHQVLEGRAVRQVHTRLHPLPAKDGDRWAGRTGTPPLRQELAQRLLDHRLQGSPVTRCSRLGRLQEGVVDVNRRSHTQKHTAVYVLVQRRGPQRRAVEARCAIAESALSIPARETSRWVTARMAPPAPLTRTPDAARAVDELAVAQAEPAHVEEDHVRLRLGGPRRDAVYPCQAARQQAGVLVVLGQPLHVVVERVPGTPRRRFPPGAWRRRRVACSGAQPR